MTATIEKRPASTTNCSVEQTGCGRVYRPNVDIVETAEELILSADMPGTNAADIDIRYERGTLDIRAKVAPRRNENASPLVREYGIGDYHRSFDLSEEIDASKIAADYRNGVLTLHLPKTAAAKPRKIAVHGEV